MAVQTANLMVHSKGDLSYATLGPNENLEDLVGLGVTFTSKVATFFKGLELLARYGLQGKKINLYNTNTLEGLTESSQVVLALHGLGFNGSLFTPMIAQARAMGYTVIAPTYGEEENPSVVMKEVVWPVLTQMIKKGATLSRVVGHSTGGDHILYGLLHDIGFQDYIKDHGTRVVLSATNTAGMRVVNGWQKLFYRLGQWHDIDDVTTKAGKARNALLNQPIAGRIHDQVVTVVCTGDKLAPCYLSCDPTRNTVVVQGEGHVLGSGVGKRMNQLYLTI